MFVRKQFIKSLMILIYYIYDDQDSHSYIIIINNHFKMNLVKIAFIILSRVIASPTKNLSIQIAVEVEPQQKSKSKDIYLIDIKKLFSFTWKKFYNFAFGKAFNKMYYG